jgi:hypothetical protein
MTRTSILLTVAALFPTYVPADACEPRSRRQVRVEGTVTAVQSDRIELSVGRRPEVLLLTERTRIPRGGSETGASALQAGDRIVVQGVRLGSGQIEALEIRTSGRTESAPMGNTPAVGGHKH